MQSKAIYALLVSAATLGSLGSVAAHADSQVWGLEQVGSALTTKSSKTRAEVKAELLQAQRQGFTSASNYRDYPDTPSHSVKSRAQVRSELLQAQAGGDAGSAALYQH